MTTINTLHPKPIATVGFMKLGDTSSSSSSSSSVQTKTTEDLSSKEFALSTTTTKNNSIRTSPKATPFASSLPLSPSRTSTGITTTSNSESNNISSSSSSSSSSNISKDEYNRGLAIIGFITVMFSSNSPVLHAAFVNSSNPPSVLLLNAATSLIALMGLLTFGPVLDSVIPLPATLKDNQIKMKEQQLMQLQLQNSQQLDNTMTVEQRQLMQQTEEGKDNISEVSIMSLPPYVVAGVELGFWKTLGTTANLYGLSLTSSNHAAFLIQLTTLIVPSVQGLMGVPVPKRIWTSIALALSGIYLFTQDMTGAGGSNAADMFTSTNTMALGDALCVVAAGFYATYDLRLFNYGKKVPPLPLIRTKIAVQAMLSCLMVATLGGGLNEIITYVRDISSSTDCFLIGSAVLWSGLIINAIVPFLQVSGQQTVGASRAQVVYASQPLWASILSFTLLGETLGENGLKGGFLFLAAIFLAASAESPDANCNDDNDNCEV